MHWYFPILVHSYFPKPVHSYFPKTLQLYFPISMQGYFPVTLDKDFNVVNTSSLTRKHLSYDNKDLVGHPITDFLNQKSQREWKKFTQHLELPITKPLFIGLCFLNKKGIEVPAFCQVSEIENIEGYKYRLTSMVAILHEAIIHKQEEEKRDEAFDEMKKTEKLSVWERPDDLRLVYEVRDYLVKHSTGQLPSMPEIAMIHGTNETKLRNDFKEYFDFTPRQVHTFLLFSKVKLDIETTTLQLKEIASQYGFQNYPAFAAKFKDIYGYSPRTARARARTSLKKPR